MWKAILEGEHDTCLIAPRCKKYKVTDFIYLLSAWEGEDAFYYTEAHILQGGYIKAFIEDLKKDSSTEKIEQKGNFVLTLNKRPVWMTAYIPLFDKRIIQTKPLIQRTDGTELWELACWDKEPLVYISTKLPKDFKLKLKSIEQTKIEELFLPHIMPKLSEQQKKVLQIAVNQGYYDFPRKIDLDDIAKQMKLTKQTIQQHLRIAEKKLVPFLTENIL